MNCLHCGGLLEFIRGEGYRHRGGGLYVEECTRCSSKFSRSTEKALEDRYSCPRCGADHRYVRDHHAAIPVAAER